MCRGKPLPDTRPIVTTPGTRVVGLRTEFGAISRFDIVRVHGWRTASGTLIAEVIEVMQVTNGGASANAGGASLSGGVSAGGGSGGSPGGGGGRDASGNGRH